MSVDLLAQVQLNSKDANRLSFISRDPISNQLNFFEVSLSTTDEGNSSFLAKCKSHSSITDNNEAAIVAAVYLNSIRGQLGLEYENQTFSVGTCTESTFGNKHVTFNQKVNGINVYGTEIKVHFDIEGKLRALGGKINKNKSTQKTSVVNSNEAIEKAIKDVNSKTKAVFINDIQKKLLQYEGPTSELIYYPHKGKLELSWKISYCPKYSETWEVFVSAENGDVLYAKDKTCFIDGPKTSHKGKTLDNKDEKIGTYQVGDTYYLIDASKEMFDAGNSLMPDDPIGVIQTHNANGLTRDELDPTFISSKDNVFGINTAEKAAVSAQFNASIFYDKLNEPPFNYNSYDNKGSSIIMHVNVHDPDNRFTGWDNASWTGKVAMFGKGNTLYKSPLSKGLDIVSHELTHGLIQKSTNIDNSSSTNFENAALIEAICDIMAIIVDGNFTIGENSNINKNRQISGLVRNPMAPHNGIPYTGNWGELEGNGYTANHMREFIKDKNAKHYNSTIISHAFYLMTGTKNGDGIGMSVASELFFDVVTNYLTSGADFNEFKNAILLAVDIRFGTGSGYYNVIKKAFDQVGLETLEVEVNPDDLPALIGENYVLSSVSNEFNKDGLSVYKMAELSEDERLGESINLKADASVTDNGKLIYAIDKEAEVVRINYGDNIQVNRLTDSIGSGYKRVAVSKFNERLALVKSTTDTSLHIYDLESGLFKRFKLSISNSVRDGANFYNLSPVEIGSMEWDYSGTRVIFDYKSSYFTESGELNIVWNIGEITVWDTLTNSFALGQIHSFYNQLSSDIDIRYPAFAKKTTSLFVHDIYDKRKGQNTVVAWSKTKNGATSTEILKTSTLAHASYTNTDTGIVVTDIDENGELALYLIQLKRDKVTVKTAFEPIKLLDSRKNPKWFTLGVRTSIAPGPILKQLSLYPNPSSGFIRFGDLDNPIESYTIFNSLGQIVQSNSLKGFYQQIDISKLAKGNYFVKIKTESNIYTSSFIKE